MSSSGGSSHRKSLELRNTTDTHDVKCVVRMSGARSAVLERHSTGLYGC